MPRILQNADKYRQADFVREIDARSAWHGIRTNADLARLLGVTCPTAGAYRENPDRMQVSTLKKLVESLNPGIAEVLRFVGYSDKAIKKFILEGRRETP